MNTFAGNITFKGNISIKLKSENINFVSNLTKDGNSVVFFYGETKLKTSKELLEYFKENIWEEIISYDLSISSESEINLYEDEKVDGEYTIMTISGIGSNFQDVVETFEEGEGVICIREAEKSEIFGEKNIKIDIIVESSL